MKGLFYKTKDGYIYKYRDKQNDYLLCSPWKDGEDRRKSWDELDNPLKINKNIASREINNQWRNVKWHWFYNGKKYEARGKCFNTKEQCECEWSFGTKTHKYVRTEFKGCFDLCKPHIWHYISDWTDRNGVTHHSEYDNTYYLVMYQGKLIWACRSQYLPQVYYYKFEAIDKEPLGNYMGWTNINCIKPVYCITDKEYI